MKQRDYVKIVEKVIMQIVGAVSSCSVSLLSSSPLLDGSAIEEPVFALEVVRGFSHH